MASFTITFAENVLVYIKGVDVNDILVLSNGKICFINYSYNFISRVRNLVRN